MYKVYHRKGTYANSELAERADFVLFFARACRAERTGKGAADGTRGPFGTPSLQIPQGLENNRDPEERIIRVPIFYTSVGLVTVVTSPFNAESTAPKG